MRIAYFSDTYPPEINGVSISVFNHAKVMKEQGHDVFVMTTNPFSSLTLEEPGLIRLPGIELKKLYGYRMSSFFSAKAYQTIKKWQPDVIHIHTDAGIGIFGKLVALTLKKPLILTYHTMYEDYTHYAGIFKGLVNRVVKAFSKSIAEQCTEFIAPSAKTKEKIRSYGADRFINIVPTGIDFSRFHPDQQFGDDLKALEKKYQLEGKKIILSIGRIAKEKSVDKVVEGYAQFLKDANRDDTVLIIAGDGPEKHQLEQMVDHLNIQQYVRFTGAVPIDKVPLYYQLADVFTSASITETQGLTFMEAMASHTLVMCRFDENLAGLIEDQKSGFIFDQPADFSKRLQHILTLSKSQVNQVTQQALKKVDMYTLPHFYNSLMEVYKRALRQYW
jgi:1,2-diacylglycerol 3-alpha-glucosyltransferase